LKSRAGLRIVSATVQYLPGKDAEGLAEEGIVGMGIFINEFYFYTLSYADDQMVFV